MLGGGGIEIIVVENTDDFHAPSQAGAILQNYTGKLTYYRNQENLGLFGNWNRCLSLAKGQWVCILHDDDILMDNYIAQMTHYLTQVSPNTSLISGKPLKFYTNGAEHKYKHVAPTPQGFIPSFKRVLKKILKFLLFGIPPKHIAKKDAAEILINNSIYPSCLLHNKELCIKEGGYNQDFYPSDDWLFHMRCALHSDVYLIDYISHKYRYDINASFSKKTIIGTFIIYYLNICAHDWIPPTYKSYLIKLFCKAVFVDSGIEGAKEGLEDFLALHHISTTPISLKENLVGKFYNIKYFD
ncbi:hypothetical protein BKH46_04790 [Helicobacter sp. 12S02634-8]|uniref:glycosyltransferase family 2 protein n=1 Tax=Helicobacter sp. 12S02634-8 TaxID=1476199 RepID=UPI000BA56706|nr:glycosyltransferase [Helicobacter sp. 12S02634-8]PAF47041.1 hypothetical protein BKH46_04790 [Helicobacter sp. 12S02634-8]